MTVWERRLLERFLKHLHSTGALSCPPSGAWIEAFKESEKG